ncbi:MAG: CDP-alcohol phosphatidyltransferase family protein [Gemmatimonas sp.]
MSLPNVITLARLLAVPIVVWALLADEMAMAFWLFVAAGVSDAIDGFIARRFGSRTVVGGFLDPLADKALLVSVYITLGKLGDLPLWLVILVVSRDILIVGGAILFQTLTHSLKPEPLLVSKLNTLAQILLAATSLAAGALGVEWRLGVTVLVWTVAATTLASGGSYIVQWSRRIASMEQGR